MSFKRGDSRTVIEYCTLEHLDAKGIRGLRFLLDKLEVKNYSIGTIPKNGGGSGEMVLILGGYSSPMEQGKKKQELQETITLVEGCQDIMELLEDGVEAIADSCQKEKV